MTRRDLSAITIFSIFFLGVLVSFAVLNRWIVTDLGIHSYGRIWQLYVSYSDFGFFRRGLIGTFLSDTGLNQLIENESTEDWELHINPIKF